MSLAEEFDPPPDEFWDARPALAHIRDFAYARMCSPWAVLGAVILNVLHHVPPGVTLPALIGGRGSLNTFVATVQRTCMAIREKLRREGDWVAGHIGRKAVASDLGNRYFDEAVDQLMNTGEIEIKMINHNGQSGLQFRLQNGGR
jgi:hypothetical protein